VDIPPSWQVIVAKLFNLPTRSGFGVQQRMCFSIQQKQTWANIFPLEGFTRH
jgi:hypothetical protein